jgi:spore germination protein PE
MSFSSILQLGDSRIINGFNRALAVQREAEIFYDNEGNFSDYPVFFEPIPLPTLDENISIRTHHLNPVIKVNKIRIVGVSASAIIHVGNSEHVSMEARVKHIRQLLSRE